MSSKVVDALQFRRTCAQFATGIAIVTVLGPDLEPHGMTVNSFTSVSLHPPLVAVSIDRHNRLLPLFLGAGLFNISILSDHQEDLSRRFASPVHNRFEGVAWTAATSGVPLLDGALAWFECALVNSVEAGDHTLLLAEVERAAYTTGRPLIYFNSGYWQG